MINIKKDIPRPANAIQVPSVVTSNYIFQLPLPSIWTGNKTANYFKKATLCQTKR